MYIEDVQNPLSKDVYKRQVGTLLSGQGLLGFPTLLKTSLGTTSFSWVMLLNTFIAIIVAYFQKTGAIQSFSQMIHDKNLSRRGAQLMAWVLGIFVYFSDSFSPLFVGSTMRSITDKARISREKLAYIADSTSCLLYTSKSRSVQPVLLQTLYLP